MCLDFQKNRLATDGAQRFVICFVQCPASRKPPSGSFFPFITRLRHVQSSFCYKAHLLHTFKSNALWTVSVVATFVPARRALPPTRRQILIVRAKTNTSEFRTLYTFKFVACILHLWTSQDILLLHFLVQDCYQCVSVSVDNK